MSLLDAMKFILSRERISVTTLNRTGPVDLGLRFLWGLLQEFYCPLLSTTWRLNYIFSQGLVPIQKQTCSSNSKKDTFNFCWTDASTGPFQWEKIVFMQLCQINFSFTVFYPADTGTKVKTMLFLSSSGRCPNLRSRCNGNWLKRLKRFFVGIYNTDCRHPFYPLHVLIISQFPKYIMLNSFKLNTEWTIICTWPCCQHVLNTFGHSLSPMVSYFCCISEMQNQNRQSFISHIYRMIQDVWIIYLLYYWSDMNCLDSLH